MVLEALRKGLRLRTDLTSLFLGAIKASNNPLEMRVLDVWIMIVVREMPQFAKQVGWVEDSRRTSCFALTPPRQVESLFRRKIKSGALLPKLLTAAIRHRARPLAQRFPAIMKLAEVWVSIVHGVASCHTRFVVPQACVRAAEPSVSSAGTLLYQLLFNEFSDAFHRQEVVLLVFCQFGAVDFGDSVCHVSQVIGALIAHTGSSVAGEVDDALSALVALTATPTLALRLQPFMVFIQGILDFVLALNDAQVRKVYDVLNCIVLSRHEAVVAAEAAVAGEAPTLASVAQPSTRDFDEVQILLRKQLTNSILRYSSAAFVVFFFSCVPSLISMLPDSNASGSLEPYRSCAATLPRM